MKSCSLVWLVLFIDLSCQELLWQEIKIKSGSRIPTPRRDAAIAYYSSENAVYIFGGKSEKPLKDMFKFNLNSKEWTVVSPLNWQDLTARFGMVHGSSGDYLYIAAGEGILLIETDRKTPFKMV